MVIKCPRKYKIYTKAKKGQILILTLLVMAIGLIIISPLLHYVDSSTTQYLHDVVRTNAYYTADAMMQTILTDIYSGIDVYNQNASVGYSQKPSLLNSDYDVNVSINYSTLQGLPAPQGSGDWLYLDPGVKICSNTSTCNTSLLLGSLALGATHNFSVYLVGGNTIKVNWTIDQSAPLTCWYGILWLPAIPFIRGRMKTKIILLMLAILVIASLTVVGCAQNWTCCSQPGCSPYHFGGSMWMKYENGSTIQGIGVNGIVSGNATSSTNPQYTLNFSWSIPAGASGNYTISFQNTGSYRHVPASPNITDTHDCCTTNQTVAGAVFGGDGATNRTWVAIGKPIGGQVYSYQDYMITATATANKSGQNIVSITAVVRHSPGPLAWWQEQTVTIPSWLVTYYY